MKYTLSIKADGNLPVPESQPGYSQRDVRILEAVHENIEWETVSELIQEFLNKSCCPKGNLLVEVWEESDEKFEEACE